MGRAAYYKMQDSRRGDCIHDESSSVTKKTQKKTAIVDFIYNGEANIYQDNLDNFISVAEELKLKGIAGSNEIDAYRILDDSPPTQELKPSREIVKQEEK